MKNLIFFILIFLTSFLFSLASGINRADEAWFLQVMRRIIGGEVPYRDIFFGAGPLSLYLSFPFLYFLGVEVIVIKIIVAACYSLTLLLGLKILQRLEVGFLFQLLFVGTNFLLAPPMAHAPYQSLANVFLMAAFNATLAMIPFSYDLNKFYRSTVVAGIWAGFGFASKQNIGGYTLLAILLIIFSYLLFYRIQNQPLKLRYFMVPTLSFLITVTITIIPICLTGGWPKFIEYGFLNKQTYMQLAGISLMEGVFKFFMAIKSSLFHITIEKIFQLIQGISFILPFLIGIGCAIGFLKKSYFRRESLLAITLFMGVAFASVFPRADYHHLIYAIPFFLTGGIWMIWEIWKSLKKGWEERKIKFHSFGTIVICCVLLKLILSILPLVQGRLVISSLPHFRGPFISPEFQIQSSQEMENLKAIGQNYKIFLLTPHAGFYYVLAELNNLTPFDYPLATTFGPHGQKEVIQAIQEGRIEAVCWNNAWRWKLRPAEIETFIEQNLIPLENLKACTLYKLKQSFGQ